MSVDRTTALDRRAVLRAGAGVLGTTLLGACSNEGRGVRSTDVSNDLELPATRERREIAGARFSDVDQVPPAYTKLPFPGYESVKGKPASGDISAMTITWGTPPKPLADNPWHQAVNEALGAKLDVTIVPAQSFGDKLVTTIASGDIPDITTNEPSYRGRAARKYLPQGVFHDLREYLGGEKVLEYPNLSLVPDYAWKNSLINGALYGVPCYRNRTVGGTLCYRRDWARRGGMAEPPENAEQLFEWLQAIKRGGGEDTYPLATIPQTFSACGCQVHRAPNNWKLNDNGSLVKDLETDEYEQSLVYANRLWKAGLVHPEVLTLTPNSAEYSGYFFSGRVGISNGSIDAYFGTAGYFAQVRQRDPEAECDVLVLPGVDGGLGVVPPDLGYYCMLSIPSSVKDKGRIRKLLATIDFLAAPLGSKEYYLVHYGVEGHNFSFVDGVPTPSPNESVQREAFLSMLGAFSLGFYFPGAEDDALVCQKYAEQMVEAFVPDPTAGLDSETSYSRGAALATIVDEYVNGIVTGDKPVSALAELRKRWRASGGDKMREEYEEAIAKAK
jgi:putative aldouronate transport system substrate-binding protein